MTEGLSVEIMPGEYATFSETGINTDVYNAWLPSSMGATIGDFKELKSVRHYGEYFKDQDAKHKEKGKTGLFEAVMQRSNPATVAVFDQLVDEFNTDLPRIKAEKDNETVQTFFRRAVELREKTPDNQDNTVK